MGFIIFLWLTELDLCTRKIEMLFGFRQLKNIDTHSRMNNKTWLVSYTKSLIKVGAISILWLALIFWGKERSFRFFSFQSFAGINFKWEKYLVCGNNDKMRKWITLPKWSILSMIRYIHKHVCLFDIFVINFSHISHNV